MIQPEPYTDPAPAAPAPQIPAPQAPTTLIIGSEPLNAPGPYPANLVQGPGGSITMRPEPNPPPASAGPLGVDIFRTLVTAPRPPGGNDYPGGVLISQLLNSLGLAGAPSL